MVIQQGVYAVPSRDSTVYANPYANRTQVRGDSPSPHTRPQEPDSPSAIENGATDGDRTRDTQIHSAVQQNGQTPLVLLSNPVLVGSAFGD